jgi:hypothetical protein
MNDIGTPRPWWVGFMATVPEKKKTPTAIADALIAAVKKALFNPRSALHRELFGFYARDEKSEEPARRQSSQMKKAG